MLKALVLLRRHAVAFTAVFLLMGGSAYAAIDSATSAKASKRMLYACVTGTHETLNLGSAEQTCPDGQRKISWNATGEAGARGAAGKPGPQGAAGVKGEAGAAGARGPQGEPGTPGTAGATGDIGPQGTTGPAGPAGPSSIAQFYALMPPDNASTVAAGTDVSFPQNGPAIGTDVTRIAPKTFNLASIGIYRVSFQVSVTEQGQLLLTLNGTDLAYTVAGRANGTSQIVNEVLVQTTTINSVLTVRNTAGNSPALTITPLAGGTRPSSASLIIERVGG